MKLKLYSRKRLQFLDLNIRFQISNVQIPYLKLQNSQLNISTDQYNMKFKFARVEKPQFPYFLFFVNGNYIIH